MQYIIICGDIVEGHEFIGPFDCFDDALEYAQSDREIREDYKIVMLQIPSEN